MIVRVRKGELKKKKAKVENDLIRKLKIWVIYPHFETSDPNLQHYYDFSQSLAEYTKLFGELNADWIWEPVTMKNFKEVIGTIRRRSGRKIPLVLNLCDGDEVNGTPGISVIHELERNRIIYTGSNTHYYDITTSKIPMKEAFDKAGVANAGWEVIKDDATAAGLFERIGSPVILKPAVSGGSMGVSIRNVVSTEEELLERLSEIRNGYRGWNLLTGGLLAEQFITGPEFTTLVVGTPCTPSGCKVYTPVERVFHESLPDSEKFLSFDRLWEIYEDEQAMPANENFYDYHLPEDSLVPRLKELSIEAYKAVGGIGYGRLDIRMDAKTGKLFVLEVNAQCGLSEDEDYTSIGAILRYSGVSFTQLILEIIEDAFHRRNLKP